MKKLLSLLLSAALALPLHAAGTLGDMALQNSAAVTITGGTITGTTITASGLLTAGSGLFSGTVTASDFNGVTITPGGNASSVSIGSSGLSLTATGASNVTAGVGAGQNATTCANDVLMGYRAGNQLTTGSTNLFIGTSAGYSTTTGGANVGIGHHALVNNVTGSNLVAIGNFAGAYETASNAFYVNNQDRTNTAGDKAKSLLYGTFNATAASQQLTVNVGTFTISGTNGITLKDYTLTADTTGTVVVQGGAGGTPASITLTNATGTAASLTAGHVTTNANLIGDVTSVGNTTTLASIPALSGANLTSLNGSNITTGTVADARIAAALTGKTYNGMGITANTGTLHVANAKSFDVLHSVTLDGNDGSTLTIGAGGTLGSLAFLSTATVSTGGTGVTTLTAYAPVFGGTTATGAVQSGTVGSSGQVLTSNGAGALPTFQTPAPGVSAANPTATIGATAVNGTAATFMRSDAAPALPANLPIGAATGTSALLTNGNSTGYILTNDGTIGLISTSSLGSFLNAGTTNATSGITFYKPTFNGNLYTASLGAIRNWILPDVSGNVITSGDTGTVTNTMLAGSIAASKLTGTDIATVGTLTAGSTGAGFTVAFGSSTFTGIIPTANTAALTGDVTKPSGSSVTTLANIPALSGANLTSLTAANVTGSHTLPDGVLSANVPLLNAANVFTAEQNVKAVLDVQKGVVNGLGDLAVYKTDDGAGNTESAHWNWSSTQCTLGTQAAGTGTRRTMAIKGNDVLILTGASALARLQVDSNGMVLPYDDASYDLGGASKQFRNGYLSGGLTIKGTTSLLLGTAGSAVGNIGFSNATSGTVTLQPPTGALGTYSVTLPNAASTLPIFGQQVTFSGPTAARTYTLPDATDTLAGLGQANTFTAPQTFTPVARSSGSASFLTITTPADTSLTASTESIGLNKTAATRQFATGALTTQREVVFGAPTFGFVGSSTLTTAINVDIADPVQGTNATLTNKYGLQFNRGNCTDTLFLNNLTNSSFGEMLFKNNSGGGTNNQDVRIIAHDIVLQAGTKIQLNNGGDSRVTLGGTTTSSPGFKWVGTTVTFGLGDGTTGGALVASGTLSVTGDLILAKTITAGGVTGAQTINKTSGSVNFAAAATSLVVTDSLCTTSSVIQCTIATHDATAGGLKVVAGSGSFTIYLDVAPTAETRVNFLITD